MRYALLLSIDDSIAVSDDEVAARAAGYDAFADEMGPKGVLLDGARLRPTSSATSVRVREGDLVVADGPFAETKEQIVGFYLVECADLDEAIAVAAKVPAAQHGTVEVRPIWEADGPTWAPADR